MSIEDFMSYGYNFPGTGGTLVITIEENYGLVHSFEISGVGRSNIVSFSATEDGNEVEVVELEPGVDYAVQLNATGEYVEITIEVSESPSPIDDNYSFEALFDYEEEQPSVAIGQDGYTPPAPVWEDGQHKIYRSGQQVMKMYRSGELIYYRLNPPSEEPEPEYDKIPFTFEVLSAGTISWRAGLFATHRTIQYSINDGSWISITSSTAGATFNVAAGDKIRFKGTNSTYSTSSAGTFANTFGGTTAQVKVYGNIMSLTNGDNFQSANTFSATYVFTNFLNFSAIVDAEHLILPATALTEGCYMGMLANSNITVAPILPATILARNCYNQMFDQCSKLNYIKCLAINIYANNSTNNWVRGVAASGTFVKDASMYDWPTGTNGIPSGWTVENYTPTPVLPSNTFLINYNAKFYNSSTYTIPKTEGQLFNEDMVLNAAASSYTSDHITVNGQYFEKSFGSTGANPFNLTNSSPFTLIAKTSRGFDTNGEHSLASCRSGGLNWVLFNPGNGSGADKVFMHNSQRLYSQTPYATITTEPNIYAIRINNGSGYGQSYTDGTTERSISVSYNGNSDRFGIFTDTYSTGGFELWKGDFYWMYISTEALTDDEIQQVINYNENINPTNE